MQVYPLTCLKTQLRSTKKQVSKQASTVPIKHWADITQLQLHWSKNKWKKKEVVSGLAAQEQQHDYG